MPDRRDFRLAAQAIGLLCVAIPAPLLAKTPAEAFQCTLPYRASMEAATSLKVLKQVDGKADAALGKTSAVDLAPGATTIFGQKPTAMRIVMFEPPELFFGKSDPTVSFEARFARTPQADRGLAAGGGFPAYCREEIKQCATKGGAATEDASLHLDRGEKDSLTLACRFKVTEAMLAG